MKLYFDSCISWNCRKSKCRQKINIRHENWFADSRLSFVTTIRFFYSWAKKLTSIMFCREHVHQAQKQCRSITSSAVDLWRTMSRDSESFLVRVDNRNAITIMKAILENIESGSIINPDSWRSYKTAELENAGFQHFCWIYPFVLTLLEKIHPPISSSSII